MKKLLLIALVCLAGPILAEKCPDGFKYNSKMNTCFSSTCSAAKDQLKGISNKSDCNNAGGMWLLGQCSLTGQSCRTNKGAWKEIRGTHDMGCRCHTSASWLSSRVYRILY